jgi:hypothetical protein
LLKVKNLNAGSTYFYDIELPTFDKIYPTYQPVLSKNGIMYDYYKVAKDFLNSDINEKTTQSLFFYSTYDGSAKHFSLAKITPEKAQKLINRNVALFMQIKNKIIENNLIDAINNV